MELREILPIVTIIVTWLLGSISKKIPWFKNYLIPVQNILIGVIIAGVEWFISKDFCVALALSGLFAGGIYDVFHNLKQAITQAEKDLKKEVSSDEQNSI